MTPLRRGVDALPLAASQDAERLTRAAGIAVLALVSLAGIDAALSLRSLFGDGFYYLLRILEAERFHPAQARKTVELIRLVPLRAAVQLGVDDLQALAVIFALSVQLAPLAITGLAWFALPRGWKFLFVFPLLHVAAGTMAGAFAPITEGATAAAYFWLLFFCLIFNTGRGMGMAVTAILAAGTVLLHEAMVFLAPLLAAIAVWRALRTTGATRAFFIGLAIWFAAVAALHAYFIVYASIPSNRDAFFAALRNRHWLIGFEGHRNLPALHGVLGVGALIALAGLQLLPARWRPWYLGWALIAVGAATILWEVAAAIAEGSVLAPSAQFNSRNNALMLSLPLAVGAFCCVLWPGMVRLWALRQTLAIVAILAVASGLWHTAATRYWVEYVDAFRNVLAGHRGFVAWDPALASLPPGEARLLRAMAHGWIEPSVSIVLAKGGEVRTILGPSHADGWQAFYPETPETLPRAKFWRYHEYLRALARQQAERGRE